MSELSKSELDRIQESHEFQILEHSGGVRSAYLAGASACARLRPSAEGLVKESEEISIWLRRMSFLKWDEKEYAPRFKAAADRLELELAAYRKERGT